MRADGGSGERAPRRVLRRAGAAIVVTLATALLAACVPNPFVGDPSDPRVQVLGDSLVWNVEAQATAELVGRGWYTSVTGHGGYAVDDEGETVAAIAAERPDAAIIALGTNDIRKIDNGSRTLEQFRADVRSTLEALSEVPCVSWVGVTTFNGYWGPNGDHRVIGPVVNDVIVDELRRAGRTGSAGSYGDWAARSWDHMDWFLGPGNVHLTERGNTAYTDLLADVAGRCGTAPLMGDLERVTASDGAVQVQGWAADPTDSEPVRITVVVAQGLGASLHSTTRSTVHDRPDVATTLAGTGEHSGFEVDLTATSGPSRVCVLAQRATEGPDRRLGCVEVDVPPVAV